MQILKYCVQCTDRKSNTIGDFAYDIALFEQGKGFHAISPVFTNLMDFYEWAYKEGWQASQSSLKMEMVKGEE